MATSDSPLNVPNVTLAVARQAGVGSPVSEFSAETGFSLSDNGDGTLTISDSQSRLGTKPNAAKPVWFFDFGSGSDQPHPTLSRQQKTILWASQCAPTQTIAKSGSTHSMIIDAAAADTGGTVFLGDGDKTLALPVNEGRKFFRYSNVYNDFTDTELVNSVVANTDVSGPNLKQHRWQSKGAQTGGNDPYLITAFQGIGTDLYRFTFLGDGGGAFTTSLYGLSELAVKKWRVEEERHIVSSAAGATDAALYCLLDGQFRESRINVDSHNGLDPDSVEGRWHHYKLANFEHWAAPGVAPWHSNLLYIDDSWCRCYITDKPTWNTAEAKALEIQIPVEWTAGQLKFHLRQGEFSSLAGKYLWVVDNNDSKILIGDWS